MKKKIAILGSTGSIGTQTLDILRKEKKQIKINLLVANKNINLLIKQIKEFKVKYVVVTDLKNFNLIKKRFPKIKIYNNFKIINSHNNLKFDYVMSAISGLDGLEPTLNIIKKTKFIAIANKESIICAWNLINNELKKYKTSFVPVDSEHFSISQLIKNKNKNNINSIYLTASGGPFITRSLKTFYKIKNTEAIKHPNWKMGKKISVDSSTLMNKVFELIEASNIFDINLNNFKIVIHPSSYVHSIVSYKSGFSELLFHETDMKIPIINSLCDLISYNFKNDKNVNFKNLNNLTFIIADKKRYPSVKLLKLIPKKISLFNTVLVSSNDALVDLFLNNKIKYNDINKFLTKILKMKKYSYTKLKKPNNSMEIKNLMTDVIKTTRGICIGSKYD